eukprot:jgi/Bigna1/133442/aug1.21_g8150
MVQLSPLCAMIFTMMAINSSAIHREMSTSNTAKSRTPFNADSCQKKLHEVCGSSQSPEEMSNCATVTHENKMERNCQDRIGNESTPYSPFQILFTLFQTNENVLVSAGCMSKIDSEKCNAKVQELCPPPSSNGNPDPNAVYQCLQQNKADLEKINCPVPDAPPPHFHRQLPVGIKKESSS